MCSQVEVPVLSPYAFNLVLLYSLIGTFFHAFYYLNL